jgi:predicted metal-binding membrane protein
MFLGGYLLAWAGIAAAAFAALARTGRLLTASPTAAKWLGVAISAVAGIYQLTPWKDWCLRRCRSPIRLQGPQPRRPRRPPSRSDVSRVLLGPDDRADRGRRDERGVMAALAVVTFAGKHWRYGKPFAQTVAVVLVAVGIVAIWFPWPLPGLHVSGMPAM